MFSSHPILGTDCIPWLTSWLGNLPLPTKVPPLDIRPCWGLINHWFPLIRFYQTSISHGGGTLRGGRWTSHFLDSPRSPVRAGDWAQKSTLQQRLAELEKDSGLKNRDGKIRSHGSYHGTGIFTYGPTFGWSLWYISMVLYKACIPREKGKKKWSRDVFKDKSKHPTKL